MVTDITDWQTQTVGILVF